MRSDFLSGKHTVHVVTTLVYETCKWFYPQHTDSFVVRIRLILHIITPSTESWGATLYRGLLPSLNRDLANLRSELRSYLVHNDFCFCVISIHMLHIISIHMLHIIIPWVGLRAWGAEGLRGREAKRLRGREAERQRGRAAERPRGWGAERLRDRAAEGPRGREAKRLRGWGQRDLLLAGDSNVFPVMTVDCSEIWIRNSLCTCRVFQVPNHGHSSHTLLPYNAALNSISITTGEFRDIF